MQNSETDFKDEKDSKRLSYLKIEGESLKRIHVVLWK
jgi:hypothetical protein